LDHRFFVLVLLISRKKKGKSSEADARGAGKGWKREKGVVLGVTIRLFLSGGAFRNKGM